MGSRKFFGFLVAASILLVVGADFDRANVTDSMIDSNEVDDFRAEGQKIYKLKLNIPETSPTSKVSQTSGDLEEPESTDPIDQGNRKILKFGKRVLESVLKNGITANDPSFIKSGKYNIDWWKHSRRLNAMRRRLSEELERNPGLKLHLESLGWRNNSAEAPNNANVNADYYDVQTSTMSPTNVDVANSMFYKISIIGYQNEAAETDSPTKFSLNTFHQTDFGASFSDFEVIDIADREEPTFNAEESFAASPPGGQVVDADRVLQLIPLIVDELHHGQVSEEEHKALRRVFGNRLWQLLVSEGSKQEADPMDPDLARFLLSGELPGRDPEDPRRGKHLRQDGFAQNTRRLGKLLVPRTRRREHQPDYNDEYRNANEYYRKMKEWIYMNFAEMIKNEPGFADLIDNTKKFELEKLHEEKMKSQATKQKRFDHYGYDDDYSYHNDYH